MPTINHGTHLGSVPILVGAKNHSKEIILTILGLSVFISTFFIPYHSFLPAWRYYDNSYTINPGGNGSFSITPSFGSTVQLMLVINGDLHLFAKNGQDKTVIDQTLGSGRYFYSFSSESGTYTIFLENNGSSVQGVYWIVWIYYYNTTFQIIGIALVSLACFILLSYKKDQKEDKVQTSVISEVKEEEEESQSPSSSDVVEQAKKILKEF